MKIGILTLPSSFNYGGILQAFALQRVLDKLGYDNVILCRERPRQGTAINIKIRIKDIIKKLLGKPIYKVPNKEQISIIEKECSCFIGTFMRKTKQVAYCTSDLAQLCKNNGIDTIIVGSDQVWRPHMTANIRNYFIDFAGEEINKIAYAASFGVDKWEYNSEDTAKCAELVKEFKLVTVREDSGVRLCNEYLGIDATHVLDPTMLLEPEDYVSLVEISNTNTSNGNLFCYILNNNLNKDKFIDKMAKCTGCKPFSVMPKRDPYFNNNVNKNINECIYPSPAAWIRAFMDAKYVITDSFHGTVFSIMFNKPFWVIGNKSRGNARFESLLKMYKLEHRYIENINNADINLLSPIDWNSVNNIRRERKEFSINILSKAI